LSADREQTPGRLLAALTLTATLTPLNSTMIAVALPAIAAAFAVSGGTATTWLVTSYLLVSIVAASPAGNIGDLIGRRSALRLGQGIFAVGALLGGLSPHLAGAVLGRIVMAAGGARIIPTVMAVFRETFVPARRARVFAALGSLMGLSAAVGPVLGGFLTARAGWQAIFLVNAPVLLIAWMLGRVPVAPAASTRAVRPAPTRGFDGVGTALLVLGLGAVAVGLKVVAWRWQLVTLGGLSLVAFIQWERRATDPLIDLQLFRKAPFVAGGLIVALQNLSMYALMFQLPFLLAGPMRIAPERSGLVLMTMMAAMVISAPIGGRVSERIGARRTVWIGLAISIAGLSLGLQAIANQSLGPLLGCLGGLGVGLGLVTGPVQAAALSAVPAGQSGVASGVLSTMRYLGGIVGVSIISVLLEGSQMDILANHRLCLWSYLGAHVVALLIAASLPNRLASVD